MPLYYTVEERKNAEQLNDRRAELSNSLILFFLAPLGL